METAADLYKRTEIKLYIETVSGKKFYIDDPVFDIEDIAHALSQQCRYTGHSRKFFSVAEHCVLVAAIMAELNLGSPFEGLMHDAAEAYLSDIAAPWKVLLPDYKILEGRIEGPLRKHFHLPAQMTDGCKRADWIALFMEAHHLITSRAEDWVAPPGIAEDAAKLRLRIPVACHSPARAAMEFLDAFEILQQMHTLSKA